MIIAGSVSSKLKTACGALLLNAMRQKQDNAQWTQIQNQEAIG